ncbi:heavy metal-associated isoprenylated plant protein 7-like [Nymphaea colorata]|nr:heavy metal-associated isoprenylated plant protein 7-like [Nymphaea colorata]
MGEEEKKEEKKEKKGETEGEIVLKVDMHCEGCARKVKRSLRGFEGVEEIQVDTKTHRVVVKGKAADPLKICQRIEKKSGRKVELISPSPKSLEEAKKAQEKQAAKQEEKEKEKKEEPAVIVAVLDVHMHCENCSQEIRRIIEKMKGVQSADPDLKSKQVTVRGAFDPASLVAYLHRRTGKHAAVVKQEVEKKEEKSKEEKDKKAGKGGGSGEAKDNKTESAGGGGEKKAEKKNEKKEGGEEGGETKAEAKKSEAPIPKYSIEYVHAPQIFSDENPNACSVM